MFNLETDISERPEYVKHDSLRAQILDKAYQIWAAQLIDPVFLGLDADKL